MNRWISLATLALARQVSIAARNLLIRGGRRAISLTASNNSQNFTACNKK